MPPLEFLDADPQICFSALDSLPRVLTCSLTFTMPYSLPSYLEEFKDKMTFTILNLQGVFGQVWPRSVIHDQIVFCSLLWINIYTLHISCQCLDKLIMITYIIIITLSALWGSAIIDIWLQHICLHELQYLQAWWYCNLLGIKAEVMLWLCYVKKSPKVSDTIRFHTVATLLFRSILIISPLFIISILSRTCPEMTVRG